MDEATKAPNDGFSSLQRDLASLSAAVAAYIRDRL
jgi:N-formylglutamate deformylase